MSFLSERLIGVAAATVDRAVAAVIHTKHGKTRHDLLSHRERVELLWGIHEEYGAPELYAHPDAYFAPPEPIDPRLLPVRGISHGAHVGRVVDASWSSRFDPYSNDMRDSYLGHAENTTSHARLFLHPEARPAVLLIHGYLGGHFRFEELVWPVRWLYQQGLDVAIVQLPFHGLRGTPARRGAPPFPGADPRMTNEGFRQAIHDLRALVRWLRSRGPEQVGVLGMSLGGYTTALLATVEPGLAFAVPMIPLASIADLARDRGRLGTKREQIEQHRALEAASFVVSPFARPSLVPSDRVLIVAAEADRITPIAHAERLSHHFAADIVRFPGGHLMQVGVKSGYKAIAEMLRRIGLSEEAARTPAPAAAPAARLPAGRFTLRGLRLGGLRDRARAHTTARTGPDVAAE